MRKLFLAVFGVFAVAGVASAQQPQYVPPTAAPTYSPAALAAAPGVPTAGTTIVHGNGCTNCGTSSQSFSSKCRNGFQMVTGGNCMLGSGCQNGCGSLKSDLAFHFGTCKQFFSPCGPTCSGGLFGSKCPTMPFAQPYGIGWQCPRQYDSYLNH